MRGRQAGREKKRTTPGGGGISPFFGENSPRLFVRFRRSLHKALFLYDKYRFDSEKTAGDLERQQRSSGSGKKEPTAGDGKETGGTAGCPEWTMDREPRADERFRGTTGTKRGGGATVLALYDSETRVAPQLR